MTKYEQKGPVENTVRAWGKGGAYVSVPSAWIGKRVKVEIVEE